MHRLIVILGLNLICWANCWAQNDTLVGKISRKQLSKLHSWEKQFKEEYQNYVPNLVQIQKFELSLNKAKKIILFLGTWCSDSREQVPRMLSVLDKAKLKPSKLKIIGVNKQKDNPSTALRFRLSKVPSLYVITKANDTLLLFEETPTRPSIEADFENAFGNFIKEKKTP